MLTPSSEVIYQVYPATFKDSNGDGHGDLNGITEKLDYIKSTGADAVWVSPFYETPQDIKKSDGGYAISDYRRVGKNFGENKDFDTLLKAAHKKGLRVYIDFVPCHTSEEHEWFDKSVNREPGFEDRYVWHDGKTDASGNRIPPNNWESPFVDENKRPLSAWTFHAKRGQFYLHHFGSGQPSLNLNDPKVQEAIKEEMRFWLDKGVDGMRLDAIPYANYTDFDDNSLLPRKRPQGNAHLHRADHSMAPEKTASFIRYLRQEIDRLYPKRDIKLIGEILSGLEGEEGVMEMAKKLTEAGLDSSYTNAFTQFTQYPDQTGGWGSVNAPGIPRLRQAIRDLQSADGKIGNALANHDSPRMASRMTAGVPPQMQDKALRQILSLVAYLPGDWFLYQGEELGKRQADIDTIPMHRRKDLADGNSRDGSRTPMAHDSNAPNGGFSTAEEEKLYLPLTRENLARAVNIQENDPGSVLAFTRKLTGERKNNPILTRGSLKVLDTDEKAPDIIAFVREYKGKVALFVYNMSGHAKEFKPGEYIDADTLKKLHMAPDASYAFDAYGYGAYGDMKKEKGDKGKWTRRSMADNARNEQDLGL